MLALPPVTYSGTTPVSVPIAPGVWGAAIVNNYGTAVLLAQFGVASAYIMAGGSVEFLVSGTGSPDLEFTPQVLPNSPPVTGSVLVTLLDPAEAAAQALPPQQSGTPEQTQTELASIPPASTSVTVTPTAGATALIITGVTGSGVVSAVGTPSGISLAVGQSGGQWVAALPSAPNDTGITVTVTPAQATPVYVYQTTGQEVVLNLPASGGNAMQNPMTAQGDLIVGGPGGIPTRQGIGVNDAILASNGSVPEWVNLTTLPGDLITGDASGNPTLLRIGPAGSVLSSTGSEPQWGAAGAQFPLQITTIAQDALPTVLTEIANNGASVPAGFSQGTYVFYGYLVVGAASASVTIGISAIDGSGARRSYPPFTNTPGGSLFGVNAVSLVAGGYALLPVVIYQAPSGVGARVIINCQASIAGGVFLSGALVQLTDS